MSLIIIIITMDRAIIFVHLDNELRGDIEFIKSEFEIRSIIIFKEFLSFVGDGFVDSFFSFFGTLLEEIEFE